MQVDGDQGQALCCTHTVPDLAEWFSFCTWQPMALLPLEPTLEATEQAQFQPLCEAKEAGLPVDMLLGRALLFHLQVFMFCCFQLIIHNLKILLCGENELSAQTFHAKMNCMKNLAFMSIYF